MKNSFKSNDELKEEEVLKMIDDTSKLVAKKNVNILAQGAVAAQSSNALANKVEFWKWMDRNYAGSGFFLVIIRCRNIFHKELEKRNGL